MQTDTQTTDTNAQRSTAAHVRQTDAQRADVQQTHARRIDDAVAARHAANRARNRANAHRYASTSALDDTAPRGFEALYGSREDEEDESSRNTMRVLAVVILSIIYWPLAVIGIVSPFLEGFNPGTLAMWQIVFSRVWLAVVLGGGCYALAVNLFHFRDARFFSGRKAFRIGVFVLLDFLVSFAVIRIVCLF